MKNHYCWQQGHLIKNSFPNLIDTITRKDEFLYSEIETPICRSRNYIFINIILQYLIDLSMWHSKPSQPYLIEKFLLSKFSSSSDQL